MNSAIADLQSRLEEFESQTDANVSNLNSYAAMQNSSLIWLKFNDLFQKISFDRWFDNKIF